MSCSVPPYQPPWYLPNGHWQTIVPSLTRKVRNIAYQRHLLPTSDGDQLQLHTLTQSASCLVVISHGLEGDSNRPYIRGMSRAFYREGYDVLAWDFRGCGGAPNRSLRFYHSGATDDLHHILTHWPGMHQYRSVILVGFSLGGNLTLKYLGEQGATLLPTIRAGITFSVPLNLSGSARQLTQPANRIYHQRFLTQLKRKIVAKQPFFPDELRTESLNDIRTLIDFDDYFTAPLHGFRDAADYYQQCSSKQFLPRIVVPTLVVNAQNDPFLGPECYLTSDPAENSPLTFMVPEQGGHCGFLPRGYRRGDNYWSEQLALAFAKGR